MATRLAITLGDPAGIGPEVTLKALAQMDRSLFSVVLVGASASLAYPFLKKYLDLLSIQPYDPADCQPGQVYFKEIGFTVGAKIGVATADNGRVAYESICWATRAIQEGHLHALVTAPICKASLMMADIAYTGHTSMLSSLTGSQDVSMAFYTPGLKVVLATIHIPLSQVPAQLDSSTLGRAIRHAGLFLRLLGVASPKIAVAGLNPHAGEGGMFGGEEEQVICPLIQSLEPDFEGDLSGPYPPDTLFYRAVQGEFDGVVALYHDQGLIPVKLMGFDTAVNVSLGLPFVRTSPDHGTAFDIVGQDQASANSMTQAIVLALRLVKGQ